MDSFIDSELGIYRYEVGTIINSNRNVICTNDLETANNFYEAAIKKYAPDNAIDHVIVFLYDYDKNANINYYDSEDELS